MRWWEKIGTQKLLSHQSGLRISKLAGEQICLEGKVTIHAQFPDAKVIDDEFQIRIEIPATFPSSLPKVFETGGCFTRSPDYHTYDDGSLCLGSEIRLKQLCSVNPNISDFFNQIVVPCFYSISYKMRYGVAPYGELAHGEAGLIDDYEKLFGVQGKYAVILCLKILGKKYRDANKLQCPCGCSQSLNQCSFRFQLKSFRHLAKRRWFRHYLLDYFSPIEQKQKQRKLKKRLSNIGI